MERGAAAAAAAAFDASGDAESGDREAPRSMLFPAAMIRASSDGTELRLGVLRAGDEEEEAEAAAGGAAGPAAGAAVAADGGGGRACAVGSAESASS